MSKQKAGQKPLPPKKKTGPAPKTLTDKQLEELEELAGYGLTVDELARFFKMSDVTLRKHHLDRINEGRAKAKATIAKSAFQMAKGGDKIMVMFWLKCQAGWSEKTTVVTESPDGQAAPKIVFEVAQPGTRKPTTSNDA